MIESARILEEMERQLAIAKAANDEQAMREALTAISSLCQVVLGSDMVAGRATLKNVDSMVSPIIQQPAVSPVMSLDSKPLIEKDANGGSIFDF